MTKLKRLIFAGVLGFTTLAMNGCDAIYWDEASSLQKVQDQQEIRVLTLKNPLVYSVDKTGHQFGIDHDLLENFAEHYNLKIKFVPMENEVEMKKALIEGKGHIAAARLPTPEINEGFLVGPAYEETFLSLFCQRRLQVENIKDLNGKSVALLTKDSTPNLNRRLLQLAPQTQVITETAPSVQDLFQRMAKKEVDCVMAENLEGEYYTRYSANIEKVAPMTDQYSLSWLVRPDMPDLNRLLQAWFQKASREDEIMRVHDRYKLYLTELDRSDVLRFMKQSRDVLPGFEKDFKKAAHEHHIPWQLLAAVAYQETQWDNEAVSFTGVRGMMQLTQDTADHLGVEDRTDPLQSIWGGAKYLRYLMNKTPRYLNFKERLALTLTAYNIGVGHLRDAQRLVAMKGKNPNSWRHLKEALPLLEDESYEKDLEYGSARGSEAVEFVERVTGFYNLMAAFQP